MPTSSHRSPDRLRGALIGFGFIMEHGHAATYRRRGLTRGDVEIVAVADICAARRDAARATFPAARIYATASELLSAEAAALDFVDIAAPPAVHAAIALAALDAGVHVLCEKPLCTSVRDATALLERARRRERVLYPCHNYNHAPVIKAVREILSADAIGPVHMVTLQTFRNTHARGVADWEPDWRRHRRHAGGGIAMDHGSHSFYLIFDWMQALPSSVSARMTTREPYDTEDDFSCTLDFPNGNATVHLTWTAGVRKVRYTLHGEGGAILVDDDRIEIARLRRDPTSSYQGRWEVERRTVTSDWMDSSHATWFDSLFDGFRAAIVTGDYVGADARIALECVRVTEAAYASANHGSRVVALERPAEEESESPAAVHSGHGGVAA